jgi:cytoskeletal protein RodZ
MARKHSPAPGTPVGATPMGAKKSGGRGRLIGLILAAVVIIALIALLLSRCGSDSPDTSGSATTSSTAGASSSSSNAGSSASSSSTAAATTPSAATPATPAGDAGTVTAAGGQSLLDAAASADPATALAALSGQPVTASAVQVLSVPADEGFWVGTSDAARVWVQLQGGGESAYQVTAGDTVDFTGSLVAHDGTFPATVGVDDTEGAAQLTAQAQHVEVARDVVTLSAP